MHSSDPSYLLTNVRMNPATDGRCANVCCLGVVTFWGVVQIILAYTWHNQCYLKFQALFDSMYQRSANSDSQWLAYMFDFQTQRRWPASVLPSIAFSCVFSIGIINVLVPVPELYNDRICETVALLACRVYPYKRVCVSVGTKNGSNYE